MNAFTGFTVACEDAFGFGLDPVSVVDELPAVAVPGKAFYGVDLEFNLDDFTAFARVAEGELTPPFLDAAT